MRPSPATLPGRIRALLLFLVAGSALACDLGPTESNGVRALAVSAPASQLRPGSFLQAVADPLDAAGNVVTGVQAKWRSLTPATLDVNPDGFMLGLAPGIGIARATVGSVSAELHLELVNPPIASLTLDVDTVRLVLPGGERLLRADARDQSGIGLIGAALTWESSAARIASVTATGEVSAVAVGSARVSVRGDGLSATAVVLVHAPSSATSPVITAVAPALAVPGQTMTVTGTGFSATRTANTVLLDGVPVAVTAASATQLTLVLPAASAFPCQGTRTVALQVGTSGGIGVSSLPLQVAEPLALAVGQAAVLGTAAAARCNELTPAAGRYVITVSNAARALGAGPIAFEVRGEATAAAGASAHVEASAQARNAAAAAAFAKRARGAAASRAGPRGARGARAQAHLDLLEANRAVAARGRLLPSRPRADARTGVGSGSRAELRAEDAPALTVPTLGSVLPVRIPALGSAAFCDNYTATGARAVYVGEHVVLLEDTVGVLDGQATLARQMDDAYAAIGAELDAAGWAAVQSFGNPLVMDSRLDDNGRVMVLFTPRMNQKVGGAILAAVVNCDLFARAQFAASNMGEYLYAQVPTTLDAGMAPGSVALWRHEIRATLVHELKHVASFAEHVVRGRPLEEPWLEEATARHAEELYARSVYGVARGSNAGFEATLACELRAGDPAYPACSDAPRAMRPHFEALWEFLSAPETHSPLGPVQPGDFTFYGSGWALTRWLVDQEGLGEPEFFTQLTTSGQTGVSNLEGRTGRAWDEILPQWALAMATDDRAGLVTASTRLRFPAWDLRSVFQGFCDLLGSCIAMPPHASPYMRASPLSMVALEAGAFGVEIPEVAPAGFAALDLLVTDATARQVIELRGYRGAALPAGVRLGIMRVQ